MKKKKKSTKKELKIDIDQILLQKREIFLFGVITTDLANNIIKKLLALDHISKKPIILWINSPGGSVRQGFAIIDIINSIKAPVITIISGQACSMAALISLAGKKRVITRHSVWMIHDMSGGISGDYTTKVLHRTHYLKQEQDRLFKFIKNRTKLTPSDMTKAKNGELWLNAVECLNKGVVTDILTK
ncbi:MAG: hypothetical protein DRO67_01920 [Candidatus Asgardarchaeum californiense]|nr:MAG: hypothetical protein DRO67_01920 [Candidatus Asgardarchaeum californiense]